jgi:cell division protein FtsB
LPTEQELLDQINRIPALVEKVAAKDAAEAAAIAGLKAEVEALKAQIADMGLSAEQEEAIGLALKAALDHAEAALATPDAPTE